MGDLTANLSRHEFACGCNRPECNRTPVDFGLATTIQACASYFLRQASARYTTTPVARVAVHINSGHRCLWYDAHIKGLRPSDFNGKKVSEHVHGIAADFWMEYVFHDLDENGKPVRQKIPDNAIADYLEAQFPYDCGIGRYDGRTHFDTRPYKARWDNRS